MAQSTERPHLHLSLPTSFEAIERVVEASDRFLGEHLDDEDLAYRVVLLASEAVTNAVEHGNAYDEALTVTFDLYVEPGAVAMRVQDEGAGFDRDAVADPLEGENLMADGGRGLMLLEQMADEVRYEDGGRTVWVRLHR